MSSKVATRVRTRLISVTECAVALEVAEQTIRELVDTGKWIGSYKIGRAYIIPRAAFERLYEEGIVPEDLTTPFLIRPFAKAS